MKRYLMILLLALVACTTNTYEETVKEENTMSEIDLRLGTPDRNAPPDGWSVSGNADCGGNASPSLQAIFPEAGQYTVQFFVETISGANAAAWAQNTLAEITWSVKGNSVRRLVSVTDGLSVSGVAQGVRVRILDQSVVVGVPGLKQSYGFSIQVSKGARASVEQPPTLQMLQSDKGIANFGQYLFACPPGGTIDIAIPDNIGAISFNLEGLISGLAGANPPPGIVSIVQLSANGLANAVYDAATIRQWEVLKPGASIIRVVNTNLAHQFLFTLNFGIDS